MTRVTRATTGWMSDPRFDPSAPREHAIRSILDGLDHVAAEMERKWGVGRLRLLASDLLRAKFDAQRQKLDDAIAADRESYIRIQVEGMKRAWVALDRAAAEAGHLPLAPEIWECVLPGTGEIVAIVRTAAEAHRVARSCTVFTLDEIARVLDGLPDTVRTAKRAFPGAEIAALTTKPPIDWKRGDDIPI